MLRRDLDEMLNKAREEMQDRLDTMLDEVDTMLMRWIQC